MFCQSCGREIPDGSVCPCQQQAQPQQGQPQNQQAAPQYQQQPYQQQPQYQQGQPYQQPYQQAAPTDNRKLYSILAYIGILWIVGLCVREKNDPRVRFHVGQGIILTIVYTAASIVVGIITAILNAALRTEITIMGLGTGLYESSAAAGLISGILWFSISAGFFVLMIIGIMNVHKNQDKPLPVIGKFAFYK